VKIVIPTYKRPSVLRDKSLALLWRLGFDKSDVVILLSEGDPSEYEKIYPNFHIIKVKANTAAEKFNAAHRVYPKGTRVLLFEDDIDDIVQKNDLKQSPVSAENFQMIATKSFEYCEKIGAKIWGMCPTPNGFYMKNRICHGLKFCVANVYGFISDPDRQNSVDVNLPSKTDYERSIRYFIRDGATVRADMISPITKNYKNSGGLQDLAAGKRLAYENAAVSELLSKYPTLVRRNLNRVGEYPEIVIKPAPKDPEKYKQLILQLRRQRAF